MSRAASTAALLLALAACTHPDSSRQGAAVRDSAGIRITENRGDPARLRLGWTVAAMPTLDIGGEDDGKLFRVLGATRLSDGRIVVASAGSHALEVYGTDGTHVQTIGHAGTGPGEFELLAWVGSLAGDTVAAWDVQLSRLSVFTADGKLVRTVTPREAVAPFSPTAGVLADGRVIVAVQSSSPSRPGISVQRDSVSYLTLASDGTTAPVTRVPGTEMMVTGGDGIFMGQPLPFGRRSVAAVHANRLFVAPGDRVEVTALEPGRGARSILRAEHRAVPVTRADIDAFKASLVNVGTGGDPRIRAAQAKLLANVPYPREKAPFADMKVDSDGNMWLQEHGTPGQPWARWIVFSPDGRMLGAVSLPGDLGVREIGPDWVLGTSADADEVEHVRLYRLEKGQ